MRCPKARAAFLWAAAAAVRIPRLIGAARMTDMMLTGRVYNAADGERVGLAQYLVPTGTAIRQGLRAGQRVAENAPLTNYALMHALPRIAEQPADQGFMTEALMAAIAQSAPEAKSRVRPSWTARPPRSEGLIATATPSTKNDERDKHHPSHDRPEIPPPDLWRHPRGGARRRARRSLPARPSRPCKSIRRA
jgi:hypothetical protein